MGIIARENVIVGTVFFKKGATIPDDLAASMTPGSSAVGDQEVPVVEGEVVEPAGDDPDAGSEPVGDASGDETGTGAADPVPVAGNGPEAAQDGPEPVPTEYNKIVELMGWVGRDPGRAVAVLAQEKAEAKPRTQLIEGLEEIIRDAKTEEG